MPGKHFWEVGIASSNAIHGLKSSPSIVSFLFEESWPNLSEFQSPSSSAALVVCFKHKYWVAPRVFLAYCFKPSSESFLSNDSRIILLPWPEFPDRASWSIILEASSYACIIGRPIDRPLLACQLLQLSSLIFILSLLLNWLTFVSLWCSLACFSVNFHPYFDVRVAKGLN
jgi:hypothetical protein